MIFIVEEGTYEGVFTLAICRERVEAEKILALLRRLRSDAYESIDIAEREFDTATSYREELNEGRSVPIEDCP